MPFSNGRHVSANVLAMMAACCAVNVVDSFAAPLEYSYRIESPQKVVEKKPGSLNDGDAKIATKVASSRMESRFILTLLDMRKAGRLNADA